MLNSIADYDSIAEYLRKEVGKVVIERDDGLLEVEGSTVRRDGEVKQCFIVVAPENVSDLVGQTYHAGTDIEEVMDKYVEERVFRDIEGT